MSDINLKLTPSEVKLEFAKGEEKSPPKFSMTAYNGGPVWLGGFDVPVIVDLAGMDISKQSIPVRLDHDPWQRIGHTTAIAIENNSLTAKGLISHDNEYSRTVAASGKNGFPWQVSIGAFMTEREELRTGESAVVNGYEVEGPMIIARQSVLVELSFVDYGADSTTSAVVSAKQAEKELVMADIEKEVTPEVADKAIEEVTTPVVQAGNTEGGGGENTAPATPDTAELIQQMREELAAEKNRLMAINKLAQPGTEELQAKAIKDGWSADKFELEMLRASRPAAPAIHRVQDNLSDQVIEAVGFQSTGMLRGAVAEKYYSDEVLTAAEKYVGGGLRRFVELACRKEIHADPRREPLEWLHAAFDATSLPGILSNTANKVLLAGYESVEDVWQKCFKKGAVSDFKKHTRYRLFDKMGFQKVGPGGELKHGELSEQEFSNQAETWGIMFSLTRQMIINDDLGALYDIPYRIGIGAADAVSDAIWSLVLSNPVSGGNAFFSIANNSLLTNGELTIAGLSAAKKVFYKKTAPNGKPINVRPKYLLVPPELEDKANILTTAEMVNETTTTDVPSPNKNPHRGAYEILVCPYLSNPSYTGASEKDYYLIADPNRIPAFEIAFLGGKDTPTVEQAEADFNTLGVQFRGYLDFGVKEQDFRGILKVQGK